MNSKTKARPTRVGAGSRTRVLERTGATKKQATSTPGGRAGFVPARRRARLTPAKVVRLLRELQGMTQNELARACGIGQPVLSAIEHGRSSVGVERARRLARALKVHPSVIVFSDWDAADAAGVDLAAVEDRSEVA